MLISVDDEMSLTAVAVAGAVEVEPTQRCSCGRARVCVCVWLVGALVERRLSHGSLVVFVHDNPN